MGETTKCNQIQPKLRASWGNTTKYNQKQPNGEERAIFPFCFLIAG
jgi:hypothetical protein